MEMDRRNFLRQAAASPLVFGLGSLEAQDFPDKVHWFTAAQRRMKEGDRRGILIVVPDAAPDRADLGKALWQRINHGGAPVHALFLEAVFIFMTAPVAQKLVGKDLQPWDRVVLGSEGKELQRDRVALKIFRDAERFEEAMAPLVYGEGRSLLLARVEQVWPSVPAELRDALERLADEDIQVRKKAREAVERRIGDLLPCLIHRAVVTSETRNREAAREIVEAHYRKRLEWDTAVDKAIRLPAAVHQAGRREEYDAPLPVQLPYGVALPYLLFGGCGTAVEEPPEGESLSASANETLRDSSFALCGMAMMKKRTITFVKFLAK
jgi:hypothetical protein